ncbi:MAG: glycerol-3-phosphate acyltransferase [Christensenellaceae bacterium]|jgi:glycerol-3-phosphate acyltransferase PlsY|nr:glycerol-3-phosphate acyltransferase [Christensenellaceae bacterium]
MNLFWLFLIIPVAYLIGSFNNAIFISHFFKRKGATKTEITEKGSGNPGTMNMWRSYGFLPAIVVFILDVAKGLLPCLAIWLIFRDSETALFRFEKLNNTMQFGILATGLAVIIGHMHPIFYKFKGGKGAASTVGILFFLNPIVGVVVFLIALAAFIITRYGFVPSIVFIVGWCIWELVACIIDGTNGWVIALMFLFAVNTLWAHRNNFKRLFNGTEKRFNFKKKSLDPDTAELVDAEKLIAPVKKDTK